jgi:Domain of unknown function (DUF4389)
MSFAEHFQNGETWKRGAYMLLFAVIYALAELVAWGVALFQFGSKLVTGDINPRLVDFGQRLSTYIYQLLVYVTFKSDDKPYPFSDWPAA